MNRRPDAQAPLSTIPSNKVAKLPHAPADQVDTYAHQPVGPWRTNSHCPCLLFKPQLRANPLLACCAWLRRLQFAVCTLRMPSQLPQNRQNRAECIAVQRRYWALKAASSRFRRILSAQLAINLDSCPVTHPRPRFDPAQPAPPEAPLHTYMQHTELNLYASFFPCSTAARRRGSNFRSPERAEMTQLVHLSFSHAQQRSPPPSQPASASLVCSDGRFSWFW